MNTAVQTEERARRTTISADPKEKAEVRVTTERITREIAKEMLTRNVTNRPKSRSALEAYSGALERGEWVFNGDPIRFDTEGRLIDGQHRLEAVARTGVPITAIVISGLDASSFATMDRGKRRTVAEDFRIDGEKCSVALAAVCRGIAVVKNPSIGKSLMGPALVREQLRLHPSARYWAHRFACGQSRRFMPCAFASVMTLASDLHGTSSYDKFFDQVSTGVDVSKGDPALTLRERFLMRGPSTSFSLQYALALMVKATNAYTEGRKIHSLRFLDTEDFPALV